MIKNNKLQKSSVIKKRIDFSAVFKSGKIYKSKFFIIALQQEQTLRFGFTTKSGLKKVTRNRLKRITRELWRLHHELFSLNGHLILMAREQILLYDHILVESDFKNLLSLIESDLIKFQHSE